MKVKEKINRKIQGHQQLAQNIQQHLIYKNLCKIKPTKIWQREARRILFSKDKK